MSSNDTDGGAMPLQHQLQPQPHPLPKSSTAVSLNDTNDSIVSDDTSKMEMLEFQLLQKKQKRTELLRRIAAVRSRRQIIHDQNQTVSHLTTLWMNRYNQCLLDRATSISNYKSKIRTIEAMENEDEALRDIVVLQDVFHIWHRGSFATINGLRLGMCSTPLAEMAELAAAERNADQNSKGKGNGNGANSNSFWNMNMNLSLNGGSASSSGSGGGSAHNNPSTPKTASTTISTTNASSSKNNNSNNDVPWHEINAAVGMIALLIQILQTKLHIQLRSRYVILPRGSTTKISSRKTQQEWELYYVPSTFQFFARRNWNAALNTLGFCLYEITREISRLMMEHNNNNNHKILDVKKNDSGDNGNGEGNDSGNGNGNGNDNSNGTISSQRQRRRQKQWVIPYEVTLEDDWNNERIGKVKVGGLDIAYNGNEIEWTKVMKYVAIDLKLIVAFVSSSCYMEMNRNIHIS